MNVKYAIIVRDAIGYFRFRKLNIVIPVAVIILFVTACDDMLEVDIPKSKITREQAFNDDLVALAVARGMYADMLEYQGFASGTDVSLVALAGLSSDELINVANVAFSVQFELNTLSRDNGYVLALWKSMYQSIYQANDILEGLEQSAGVTEGVKRQLKGEALFIRAFSHFYLVNLFGEVPVIITTDFRANAIAPRQDVSTVYAQIEKDLLDAQQLLPTAYAGSERVRPIKAAATAMLARVYLYREEWAKAEAQATAVIDDVNYSLVGLSDVTLANNEEAIWQLRPTSPSENPPTNEGVYFNDPASFNALRADILNVFEDGDAREVEWIRNDGEYYVPFKYRVFGSESPRGEYSIVLRLAEQYLIRAEGRARQGDLAGAIADVDVIRNRAQLPLIQDTNPGIGQEDLLLAIEKERQVELFAEWGHRWLDLKRTGRATTVLSSIKTEWNFDDELYPVPQSEFLRNPKLGNQNPGY